MRINDLQPDTPQQITMSPPLQKILHPLDIPPPLALILPSTDSLTLESILYGTAYGSGPRALSLKLVSFAKDVEVCLPISCHYIRNKPSFTTSEVSKTKFMRLTRLVVEKGELSVGIVLDREGENAKVFRGRLMTRMREGEKNRERDGEGEVKIKLRWQEEDEVMLIVNKMVKWFKKSCDK